MSASVTATVSASSTQATVKTAKPSESTLGYNEFLQLLIAQMKNQDPMDPLKSSDYVAQLATFSQVEKSVQMSDKLGELLTATQLQQADAILGRYLLPMDGAGGVVTASKIVSGSVIAILDDGRHVKMDDRVTLQEGAK